jgi:hypothetical protein
MNTFNSPRRNFLTAAAAAWGLAASGLVLAQSQNQNVVEVWKDPNCGCCKDWVAHLEKNGFKVQVHETGNNAVRARLGMPENLGSCHTALVQGYVIEGHVPASDITRLLKEKPRAIGLAVPGMPVGSPGMDGEVYGGRRDRYDVLLVLNHGSSKVFNTYS